MNDISVYNHLIVNHTRRYVSARIPNQPGLLGINIDEKTSEHIPVEMPVVLETLWDIARVEPVIIRDCR